MYRQWAFFRTVIDNAQLELLRAHLPTSEWYSERVRPKKTGARIHAQIAAEYGRTCDWVLKVTEQERLLEKAAVIRKTVELRNPVLAPLSKLQVALLDEWDRHPEEGESAWHDALLLSIIGVAAAMQSTG
jgi:phosphoenolpyruvate carboxylase